MASNSTGVRPHPMTSKTIAHVIWWAKRPDELSFPFSVQIGEPYAVLNHKDEWACSVSMHPLFENLKDMHGADSFQALRLASGFALDLLKSFQESGGVITYSGGEPVDLKPYA